MPTELRSNLRTRIAAGAALTALVLGAAQLALTAYRALSDAWVAPIQLSPDNDKVVALRLEQARYEAERRRMQSELVAADEEIRSIDLGTERLEKLRSGYGGALEWAAGDEVRRRATLERELATLEKQQALLAELLADARARHERAKLDLAGGLITSAELARSEVELHQRQLDLQTNDLQRMHARSQLELVRNKSAAFSEATRESAVERYAAPGTSSPDLLRFDEPAIRLELEIARLHAEKRAAEARRRAVQDSLNAMDTLLAEVRSRPLYRAMTHETDLAFVPYAGLADLQVGNEVFRCAFAVFGCESAGWVREIVPGEVVTQDPWGEIARGQYVVLTVDDASALHEKVLRVRPGEAGRKPDERLTQRGD